MQRDARRLREALHAVRDHLGAQIPNLLALESQVDNAVRSVGDVDHGSAEGLVEGAVGEAEALDADGGAEGLGKGVSEGDADVFGRVVVIDCFETF